MRNDVFFFVTATLLAAVVAMLIFWLQSQQTLLVAKFSEASSAEIAEPGSAPESLPATINPRADYRYADRSAAGVLTIEDANLLASDLHSPDTLPERDLEILHTLVDLYRRANDGQIPSGGLNEEIVDVLRGLNSKHLAVLPPGLPAISATGELRDRWGTPYFFHPVSSRDLEIISAGPDRKFGTPDDVGRQSADHVESASLAHGRL